MKHVAGLVSLKKAFAIFLSCLALNAVNAYYGDDFKFRDAFLKNNVWKQDWQVRVIPPDTMRLIETIVARQRKDGKAETKYATVIPPAFEQYVSVDIDALEPNGQKIKTLLVPGTVINFNDGGKFEALFLDAPYLKIQGSWQISDGVLSMSLDKDYPVPYAAGTAFNYTIKGVGRGGIGLYLDKCPIADLKKIIVASDQAIMEDKEVVGAVIPRVDIPKDEPEGEKKDEFDLGGEGAKKKDAGEKAEAGDDDDDDGKAKKEEGEESSKDEEKTDDEGGDKEEKKADDGKKKKKGDTEDLDIGW